MVGGELIMLDIIKKQLETIKILLEGLIEQIEDFEQLNSAEQACDHPPEHRLDLSTMGHIRWVCRLCGYVHEEDVSKQDGQVEE